jgi:eukaryotic-like serine/threonine-protein kinase
VFIGAVEEAKRGTTDPARRLAVLRRLQSLVALAESKPADAVSALEPITFDIAHQQEVAMWCIAQLRQQHWLEASKGLEWLVSRGPSGGLDASTAFALVSLAKVQASLGHDEEARKTYQKFFDLWKEADPDVPMLVQARRDFEKLPGS